MNIINTWFVTLLFFTLTQNSKAMHSARRASERELKNLLNSTEHSNELAKNDSKQMLLSGKNYKLENTFRTEPRQQFSYSKAHTVITDVLSTQLTGVDYSSEECPKLAVDLCDQIRVQVKQITPWRYKVAVIVHIGQKNDQALFMASRCLWNADFDTFTSASFSNSSLYAVGIVYACYFE